jgi:serine O-acetyltransferase
MKILADLRYKRDCYGYPADTVHLLRVLLSDGSAAMILYRVTRFLYRIKLGFLGYPVAWLNKVINGCVIGRHADFDEGFVIMHPMGVVINGAVKGGKNIVVESGVVVGAARHGMPVKAPLLGSHIFIGSGAKLLGEIIIGSHVAIGANAVVVKDVPHAVTVAGVPAKVIEQHSDEVRYENALS